MELGDNIVCNKLYRDYRFKSKRNYGLYVRLLKVEDTQKYFRLYLPNRNRTFMYDI